MDNFTKNHIVRKALVNPFTSTLLNNVHNLIFHHLKVSDQIENEKQYIGYAEVIRRDKSFQEERLIYGAVGLPHSKLQKEQQFLQEISNSTCITETIFPLLFKTNMPVVSFGYGIGVGKGKFRENIYIPYPPKEAYKRKNIQLASYETLLMLGFDVYKNQIIEEKVYKKIEAKNKKKFFISVNKKYGIQLPKLVMESAFHFLFVERHSPSGELTGVKIEIHTQHAKECLDAIAEQYELPKPKLNLDNPEIQATYIAIDFSLQGKCNKYVTYYHLV